MPRVALIGRKEVKIVQTAFGRVRLVFFLLDNRATTSFTMAPIKRGPLFPRRKLRKLMQAHSNLRVLKSAEPLVCLGRGAMEPGSPYLAVRKQSTMLTASSALPELLPLHEEVCAKFAKSDVLLPGRQWRTDCFDRLCTEAYIDARQHGERGITERSLKRVGSVSLLHFTRLSRLHMMEILRWQATCLTNSLSPVARAGQLQGMKLNDTFESDEAVESFGCNFGTIPEFTP